MLRWCDGRGNVLVACDDDDDVVNALFCWDNDDDGGASVLLLMSIFSHPDAATSCLCSGGASGLRLDGLKLRATECVCWCCCLGCGSVWQTTVSCLVN